MGQRVPVCPRCGEQSVIVDNRFNKKYACCGLWSWGEKPLVDAETHLARQAAHAAFDSLWLAKTMSRGKAYEALSIALGVPEREAHMAIMSKELARQVPQAVAKIRNTAITVVGKE
jgi:hypothetical protein